MTKKILIGGALLVLVIFLFLNIGKKNKNSISDQKVYQNTIDISRNYVALRVKTDKILTNALEYSNYDDWNNDMKKLIGDWEDLETKAKILEIDANLLSQNKLSFEITKKAQAYTKDEISNVFDKAPAGKKIKTLAKYLGVDAKRAYKILKNDQEFVKADAWNEAGDTFKKLETSAVVIKDGCKVAGYVGAAVMTGGAATAVEGTTMIVTGSDLILEIEEDTATIMLGDNHKGVKAISDIRAYTDPAASILSLTDIPKNVAKGADLLDKVGVVLMEVDQIRSVLQDGKLLGINIRPDSKVEVAAIKKDEVKKWIDEHSVDEESSDEFDDWFDNFDDLGDWMDEFDDEVKKEEEDKNNDKEELEVTEEGQSAEKAYTKDGKVAVSIVSPADSVLSSGGNQMWKIKVDGYEYYGNNNKYTGKNRGYECFWDFYTEYDDGVKPWMNIKGCGSTHGVPGKDIFIGDPPGKLRVVVRVNFLEQDYIENEQGYKVQNGKKVAETVVVEKTYEISPYFIH